MLGYESCSFLWRSSDSFKLGFVKKLITPHRDVALKRWVHLIWFSIASLWFFKIFQDFSRLFCQKRWQIEVHLDIFLSRGAGDLVPLLRWCWCTWFTCHRHILTLFLSILTLFNSKFSWFHFFFLKFQLFEKILGVLNLHKMVILSVTFFFFFWMFLH